jgi:hypothetical protein
LRGLQDRFEQVILITHIEPVREGLDRVINVGYDADRGCSVVTESEGEGEAVGVDDEETEPAWPGRSRSVLPGVAAESGERTAGAGA